MDCRDVRIRLTSGETSREIPGHLERCEACTRFAARAEVIREALRTHHAGVEPDPAFAVRVSAALPLRASTDSLGWAASRLLPAMLALAVALGWAAMSTGNVGSVVEDDLDGPTDDVLAWALEVEEDQP